MASYAQPTHRDAWTFRGVTFDSPRALALEVALEWLAPRPSPYATSAERDRRSFWFFLWTFTDEQLAGISPVRCPDKGHEIEVPRDCLVEAFAWFRYSAGQRKMGAA